MAASLRAKSFQPFQAFGYLGEQFKVEGIKQSSECAYVVAGGYGKDGKPLSSAEVFDKTSNSWIPLKPMKTCRAESSSVVYNGQVFVTGGTSDCMQEHSG